MLWKELRQADWHTLAEWFGIENEDVVDAALRYLRLEPMTPEAITSFVIYYRPEGLRQIYLKRIEAQEASGYAKEAAAELERRATNQSDTGLQSILGHLARTQEVVNIEFSNLEWTDPGWPMGEVIAYELARLVARHANGYLDDDQGKWWRLDGWIWKEIYVEP
jgi:hypothetical protein